MWAVQVNNSSIQRIPYGEAWYPGWADFSWFEILEAVYVPAFWFHVKIDRRTSNNIDWDLYERGKSKHRPLVIIKRNYMNFDMCGFLEW